MKISGSFVMMLIVWLLGFTHFFGGPYVLFKIIFWIALLPYIIATTILLWMFLKAKKIFKTHQTNNNQETLHVEATIKE